MACVSLTAFTKQCGAVATAGAKKIYMIAYNDLTLVDGANDVYTTALGVVNEIGNSTKKFVGVGVANKSSVINENVTVNENGTVEMGATFNATLTGFSKETGEFVKQLIGQDVVVLVQLMSKRWVAVGLDGGFALTSATGELSSSVTQRGFTLGGDISDLIPEIDPTLIASLI